MQNHEPALVTLLHLASALHGCVCILLQNVPCISCCHAEWKRKLGHATLGYVFISHENLQNINCNVITLVPSISFHRLTCTNVTESATLCGLPHLELENRFQLLFCWLYFPRMPKSNRGSGYSFSYGRYFLEFSNLGSR